jgi:SAM-dependent methyltransferase
MESKMKEMWNSRYSSTEFAYGTAPNQFFKETLSQLKPKGKILLPAEGEGRNAVYAAKQGLDVTAFDISSEGKKKALRLAMTESVELKYEIGNLFVLDLVNEKFDLAALIFAHFPPPILSKYHNKIADLIKDDGMIILEGFSKNNLPIRIKNPKVGGPDKIDMLFSKESIAHDFSDFEIINLEEVEIELHEGSFHNGTAKVIRFIGRKL